MPPMKLLHVIPSANPESGGPIASVQELNRTLTDRGHISDTLCLDSPTDPWIAKFSPGKLYALGPAISGYKFTKTLLPWLKQNATSYHCIIVHGIWQYHSFAVRQALRHSKTPYFVFPHGMLDPWFKHTYPLKHLKKWLYWPWGEYQVLAHARAVLFTCEEERRLARLSFWLYQCHERVVNFGIAAPEQSVLQQHIFQDTFPALQGKRLLLFLGRLHPKKGCDLLIEAFAHIAREDDQLHLVMAGPDSANWQTVLQQQVKLLGISHRVSWTGMLSGNLKLGALQSAELFILPSHQENFGIAVVEAMACGLPVLISNKVNIWKEVVADGAGLVAEDNCQSMVAALHRWLDYSNDEKSRIKFNAKQSFMRQFEINQFADDLLEVLSTCEVG